MTEDKSGDKTPLTAGTDTTRVEETKEEPLILGTVPFEHQCRFCKYKGLTQVTKVPGRCQTIACYSFLVPIFLPLSIVACVSNVFYETEHCCGKCHRHIGLVKPCTGGVAAKEE